MLHVPIYYLLERCSSMEVLKRVHVQILIHGLSGETFIIGKFIAFCSLADDADDLSYARAVFDRVTEPNRYMWNSLIRGYSNSDNPREGLFLQHQMLSSGILPNDFTLPFVLKSCAFESAFRETQELHGLILKLGFRSQVFVQNSLVHAYAVCKSIDSSRKVFDEIPYPNIISWNSIIDGYARLGNLEHVFQLFRSMRYLKLAPDGFTLASLLSVCSQTGSLNLGKLVHHSIEINGGWIDLIVGNALVDMYAKCGDLSSAEAWFHRMPKRSVVTWTCMVDAYAKQGHYELARFWFHRMPERNLISWNSIITSYAQHGQCRKAFDIFREMVTSKVKPDDTTLTSILSICGQVGDLITGKKIHQYIVRRSMQTSISLMNALIDVYAKCGLLSTASYIFSQLMQQEENHLTWTSSWNVMIRGFAMHGCALDAIKLCKNMVCEGIAPDGITFVAILSACSHGGLLEDGLHYLEAMQRCYNVKPEMEHYGCIIDLLGRRGDVERAIDVIGKMPMKADMVIWGVVLGACRIHGNVKMGKVAMKQMLELQASDAGVYVLISNLCSEAHKWGDGKNLRKLMRDKGIRKVGGCSLIEIGGDMHEFMVEDKRHQMSTHIYSTLQHLNDNLMSTQSHVHFL